MNTELIRHRILEQYEAFSPTEKRVADYLLYARGDELPSSGEIARELYVSEATLTRFAKRCGFHGFRELRYSFPDTPVPSSAPLPDPSTGRVENAYQSLLERTFSSIDGKAVERIAQMLPQADKILICGIGHSGISALEYRMRLLRIGLNVEASNESHMLRIMASLLTENSMLIALSVSGTTKEIVQALQIARSKGSATVLITAAQNPAGEEYCNEILRTGSIRNLTSGIIVSPQLPLLFVFDLLYSRLISNNYSTAMTAHGATLTALGIKPPPEEARHHAQERSDKTESTGKEDSHESSRH